MIQSAEEYKMALLQIARFKEAIRLEEENKNPLIDLEILKKELNEMYKEVIKYEKGDNSGKIFEPE